VLYARGGRNKLGHLKTRNGSCFEKKNALRTLLKLCMLHVLLLGRALLGEHAMGDHGGC
jgi:hypothetical protein